MKRKALKIFLLTISSFLLVDSKKVLWEKLGTQIGYLQDVLQVLGKVSSRYRKYFRFQANRVFRIFNITKKAFLIPRRPNAPKMTHMIKKSHLSQIRLEKYHFRPFPCQKDSFILPTWVSWGFPSGE